MRGYKEMPLNVPSTEITSQSEGFIETESQSKVGERIAAERKEMSTA